MTNSATNPDTPDIARTCPGLSGPNSGGLTRTKERGKRGTRFPILSGPTEGFGNWVEGGNYNIRGQHFVCVGWEPYVNKFGEAIVLLCFATHCAECGERFTAKVSAGTAPDRFYPSRKCEAHRRPYPAKAQS